MPGLLDFLMQGQGGGGLLGGMMGGNGPQSMPDAFGGNQGMMLAGLGLASGATPGEGFKNMMPALMQAYGQQQQRAAAGEFGNAFGGMIGQQPAAAPGRPPMSPQAGGIFSLPTPQMPSSAPQNPGAPSSAFTVASDGGLGPPAAPSGYNARLTQVESGGNPNAQNPNSSATGPAQFTDATWRENFDKTFPAQAAMPDAQKLALRTNPQVVTPVLNTFTQANEQKLTSAGVPITDMSRYAAHFFGADDATKVLKAEPNVPLANLIQPASIKANPFLQGMTAGQAQEWIAGKMGGGAPQAQGVPNNPMQSPAAMNPAGLIKALSNPNLPEGLRKTGEMMFQNYLDQSKMTTDQKEYLWAKAQGYAGGFSDYQKEMKAAGGTNVTVNTAGEKSYEQKVGAGQGDYFLETQKAGRDATGALANYSVMNRLIQSPDFYSGTGGQTVTAVKRALVSAGIKDAETAAPNELFQKLANKTLLDASGGSLGSGFSNADREFMANTNANISNTPAGNKAIIDMAVKVEERKQQVAQMARTYATSHGGRLDTGFDEQLSQWAKQNPLFPAQPPGAQQQAAPVQEGATATNKATGQKIMFKGGQWVPAQASGPQL